MYTVDVLAQGHEQRKYKHANAITAMVAGAFLDSTAGYIRLAIEACGVIARQLWRACRWVCRRSLAEAHNKYYQLDEKLDDSVSIRRGKAALRKQA